MLSTSVIKRSVRHTEAWVCSRTVIQGHSTAVQVWGSQWGLGRRYRGTDLINNSNVLLPPGSVILYLMNYTAPNQHHNPSRPLSQKVLKEEEGQEEERLWCKDENIWRNIGDRRAGRSVYVCVWVKHCVNELCARSKSLSVCACLSECHDTGVC